MKVVKKSRARSAVAVMATSLLLAGAVVAMPSVAHAGTIVESGGYTTEANCNYGKHFKKLQGYNVAPRCTYNAYGVFGPWSFWYEKK